MKWMAGLGLIMLAGCANTKNVQLTPQDFAQAGACYAQVATLIQTAQQQVSSCVSLVQSIKAKQTGQ